jgi:DNA-binding winged helix-turn-helix (wHTH) protein/tetratricopeptide (TPR) repeat protein
MDQKVEKIEIAGLRLDFRNQRLEHQGCLVDLRPKSWALLKYMVARPAQLLGKDELVQAVWGDRVVTDASLNQVVRELRKALGDDARSPRYIETVHRRGFRFLLGADEAEGGANTNTEISRRSAIFGRDQELDRLQQLYALAAAGHSQFCFVTGEAGIGKTSLVQQFLNRSPTEAKDKPLLLGRGQCIDHHGEGEAYLPILEALDRLARGPAGEMVRTCLEHYAPMWLVQMPWLLPPDHSYDVQLVAATPARMLRELCVFLEALTTDTTLILWLEDLHWADSATSELLDSLARRQEAARLLVIISFRPVDAAVEGSPIRPLKLSLVQQHRATELELELLKPDEVCEYLSTRFEGIPQLPELTGLAHELSDGNPLFIVTLADYLVTHDLLTHNQDGWAMAAPIETIRGNSPESLKGIIDLQLHQLTPNELLLLETASVVGTRFPAQALAGMLGLELNAIELTCDQLAQRHQFLIADCSVDWPDNSVGQGYVFNHDVYRQVLYNRLPHARRQRLHLAAGLIIEEGYPQQVDEVSAELALHFELGHDPQRAIFHLRLAAERAQQRAAAAEAVAYLNRSLVQLATLPGSTENQKIELDLRLRLMRLLITAISYTAVEQETNLDRALELCEQLGDSSSEIQLLSQRCSALILQGDIEAADNAIIRTRKATNRTDNPVLRSHEPAVTAFVALAKGELETAETHFARALDLLDNADLREPSRLFGHDPAVVSFGFSAISAWMMGQPEEARRRAQLALARSEAIGNPQGQAIALDTALSVEHLRRDVAAAIPLAAALDACLNKYSVEYPYPRPRCARNWLLLESGDATAAQVGMQRDIEKARDARTGLYFPLMYITLSEAYLTTGAAGEGIEAIEKAFIIINAGERLFEAEAWRLRGELLRLDSDPLQAQQCFRTALQVASDQSALALELRAATSLAGLHRDTGQAADARERLQAVIDRFTEGFDTADFQKAVALAATLSTTKTA